MRPRFLAIGLWLSLAWGCAAERNVTGDDDAPDVVSPTLHESCDESDGCSDGETCATRGHPEGEVVSCEISCTDDADCPPEHECNAPPCMPDDVFCTFCAPRE
jgi:hypothetical protein